MNVHVVQPGESSGLVALVEPVEESAVECVAPLASREGEGT